jgi:predicted amidohydrolase YtcJ
MHRIEHLETVMDSDLPRFLELDVAASMQPLHMEGLDDPSTPSSWSDGLSDGRLERGFRAADLAAAGAIIPLGSDWSVADFDPRVGMAWTRLRRRPGHPERVPYLPSQALTAEQTLLGYTTWAAAVEGPEAAYGRLSVGLAADVSVFGEDLVEVGGDELIDVPVAATIVDGEVVFRSEDLS